MPSGAGARGQSPGALFVLLCVARKFAAILAIDAGEHYVLTCFQGCQGLVGCARVVELEGRRVQVGDDLGEGGKIARHAVAEKVRINRDNREARRQKDDGDGGDEDEDQFSFYRNVAKVPHGGNPGYR